MGEPEANVDGLRIVASLCYPNRGPRMLSDQLVEVDLNDVRAADSIIIRYDFGRDGWAIFQASTFQWSIDDPVCDPDWQEVAFIQAWAREEERACVSGVCPSDSEES